MGTPDFAVPCLQSILDAGHEVCAVFTQPDKPKGRGYTLTPPPVKELALTKGIAVFQPATMKDGTAFRQLESLHPDVVVVVAYGKILPKEILELPRYGCINVHASLLPKYRGAAPIQWAVLRGEATTGVTTMQMDVGLDTGDMLQRIETAIGENETAGELHDRLALLGAEILCSTLLGAEQGTLVPQKQDDTRSCYAPMLHKGLSHVDFTKSAQEVHNQIRGLTPWPCANAVLNGKTVKLFGSSLAGSAPKGANPGEIIGTDPLQICCGDGAMIQLAQLQPEGKKRMNAGDYFRGHPLQTTTYFNSEP